MVDQSWKTKHYSFSQLFTHSSNSFTTAGELLAICKKLNGHCNQGKQMEAQGILCASCSLHTEHVASHPAHWKHRSSIVTVLSCVNQQPPQPDERVPRLYLKEVFEIASGLSKSSHHTQLNQRVRSQGMMGIFRQGEPRSSVCRIVATFASALCPVMLRLWQGNGDCSAERESVV